MAVLQSLALEAPASVAAGAAMEVGSLHPMTVYVSGTFVATLQIQISLDGTNWVNEGSAFTAGGVLHIDKLADKIRVNTTAFTSGTPVVKLLGKQSDEGG